MDGDAYDRRKFLAEEKERAWASARDVIGRSSTMRFSINNMHDAFNEGWDCGAITMEREMSARVSNLEGKLAMAYADACLPAPKNYMRDTRLQAQGMREAAEIARNYRPASACTCGSYISFHNGVPSHQPGCLVGECLDLADEIEGRAEEIDLSNRDGGSAE